MTREQVNGRIEERLNKTGADIEHYVAKAVGTLDIRGYVAEVVADCVKALWPQQVIQLIQDRNDFS